ncbi:GGDEF domain-containing protein [Neptuniibacter sp. PT8_73]|uniref:GGDEF domain-containing protein n=1 Tax=unclassified Neptuniibacter TaxID=2630693 RepID=UPI0039F7015C
MERNSFVTSLLAALQSKLARKIAFFVFLSLIVIEILILIPSYLKRENELVYKQEKLADLVVKNIFSQRSIPFELQSIEQLNTSLSMDNILGFSLEENDQFVSRLGKVEGELNDIASKAGLDSFYHKEDERLDLKWVLSVPEAGDRQVTMHLDVSFIDTELQMYVVRIAGLVLIISAFVTLSTMAVLWWLVLNPILKLEDKLKIFSNLENAVDDVSPFSVRNDEIGELFIEFGKMRHRILQAANEISKLAVTDQLTGLYNRRKLDDAMLLEIERVKRYQKPLSVIMCDLDHFKMINDTYGHKTGDDVIVATAHLIKKGVRASDIVGRWGGEEFLIICPHSDQQGATVLAEKIRLDIGAYEGEANLVITASFGVAEYISGEDSQAFLCRADKALYIAKSEGRNQVRVDT